MQAIEPYSLHCARLIESCVRKSMVTDKKYFKKFTFDYQFLLDAVIHNDEKKVFKNIMENYLFKLELNKTTAFENSSYISGKIINLILKNIKKISIKSKIIRLTEQYFNFLCKKIVETLHDY